MKDIKQEIITNTLDKLHRLEKSEDQEDKMMFNFIIGTVNGLVMMNESHA